MTNELWPVGRNGLTRSLKGLYTAGELPYIVYHHRFHASGAQNYNGLPPSYIRVATAKPVYINKIRNEYIDTAATLTGGFPSYSVSKPNAIEPFQGTVHFQGPGKFCTGNRYEVELVDYGHPAGARTPATIGEAVRSSSMGQGRQDGPP